VFSGVTVTNRRPRGVGLIEEALATKFRIHAIMNVVGPAGERGRAVKNVGREGLELVIVREGGATVLTRQNIGQQSEPGRDGAAVGLVANRLGGHKVKEFPARGAPESCVHFAGVSLIRTAVTWVRI
jgi:hypothetical protein